MVSSADRVGLRSWRQAQDITRRQRAITEQRRLHPVRTRILHRPAVDLCVGVRHQVEKTVRARAKFGLVVTMERRILCHRAFDGDDRDEQVRPGRDRDRDGGLGDPAGTTGAAGTPCGCSRRRRRHRSTGGFRPQPGGQRPPATTPPSIRRRSVLCTSRAMEGPPATCSSGWGREQPSERDDGENTGTGVTHGNLLMRICRSRRRDPSPEATFSNHVGGIEARKGTSVRR